MVPYISLGAGAAKYMLSKPVLSLSAIVTCKGDEGKEERTLTLLKSFRTAPARAPNDCNKVASALDSCSKR